MMNYKEQERIKDVKESDPEESRSYIVGVMQTPVESEPGGEFAEIVDIAITSMENKLTQDLRLRVKLFEFVGPHLSPTAGAYSPLDYLKLGLAEKLERDVNFLLIVTEVDLSTASLSYVVALPSQLTNIGIISTKRLSPSFWGKEPDMEETANRLAALMLHTLGHLLNVPHSPEPSNVMYDFQEVEHLSQMEQLSAEQIETIRRNLPWEAREKVGRDNLWMFALGQIIQDRHSIWQAVKRASPFDLITRLPTMITAALSVVIVLFFSAEVWDVGGTVDLYQLVIFSLVSLAVATLVLYRAFTFGAVLKRGRGIAESTVVTEAAVLLSLMLTMLLLYVTFLVLMYLGTVTIFPRRLMATWPTVDPATRTIDHVKLSMFLAAMGVLAGSLGGRADSRDLVRHVLFLDEET